jgi:hypothetical protein|nr:fibronectin type III domain-containing protein [Kofleriaceae bacterium]
MTTLTATMNKLGPLLLVLAIAPAARADAPGECHAVTVDFLPSPKLQIVAWIEDANGHYVDTAYITQETGTYGLGNRPGRFDFNSGPSWPYGRRITTFPVWSHKHGQLFPQVDFQDGNDSDISHASGMSSHEPHYCRPLTDSGTDKASFDAGTCPTPGVDTDKGVLDKSVKTGYPPRTDITETPGIDTDDVAKYVTMNPFDAVSTATPVGDTGAQFTWTTPGTLADGPYTIVIETSQEFDQNASYNFPAPSIQSFGSYGLAYRGQPSVIYRVPVSIGSADDSETTSAYAGYGSPDGSDGNVRPPDSTITSDAPHTGASRLGLTMDGTTMYRVRAQSHVQFDAVAPAAVGKLDADTSTTRVLVSWVAPGDDGTTGQVTGYDIRISAVAPITAANFDTLTRVPTPSNLVAAGQEQTVQLANLLPDTDYFIGVEALDDCHNTGSLQVLEFHTVAASGQVDACFVATAAYGSLMANDVTMLRRFRDLVLRRSVLGELFVESYYTFGPPVAGVVGESELLRASARDALAPLIEQAKAFTF